MSLKKILSLSLLSIAASGMTLAADTSTRSPQQSREIEQASQSGKLTEKEKAELKKKQAGIEEEKAEAKSDDGVVTPGERDKIHRMEDRQEKRIQKQKND